MAPFEAEEFWDDLLAFIEEGRVIPVVGSELLMIQEEGSPAVPLYRAVADRLLGQYKLSPLPQEHYGIYEAVSAVAAQPRVRMKDLYRQIHDILKRQIAEKPPDMQPLRDLASIQHFNLFATTTPDDLLARALSGVRGVPVDEILYAPLLPTDRRRDIPEAASSRYTAVFYLFGKADVGPFYAIHDEDSLEFPYTLQAGNGPERMFSQMRSRSLLLVGCTFADWLSRFFIRLSNPDRLFSDQRTKKEYLVGEETARGGDLTLFLERFSQDSRCFPTQPAAFTAELYRRWRERNPASEPGPEVQPEEISSAGGTIFISYSSGDLGAAKLLFDDLQKMGGDVAWFDKSALKPGDNWERHILGAIQKCSLFLPLLSSNTEQRTDGYFRLEWDEAAERARKIAGRKFLFPIVIDNDYGGDMSRYALLPERFKSVQYSHAPGGQMGDALRDEIKDQLRALRRSRTS
ncbi:MAG: toll/interleukin-1 receptor domain-containing protein [Bryobacteraceae bacterium]